MLLNLLHWLHDTPLSEAIRQTRWSMPVFLVFHALGMTLLIGTIIIVSLRLLGVMMRKRPIQEIETQLKNWSLAGMAMMLVSGLLLFMPEPLRWYGSSSFWIKMTFLFLALLFHFTVYRWVTRTNDVHPLIARISGGLALLLWYGVAVGGRALTFE